MKKKQREQIDLRIGRIFDGLEAPDADARPPAAEPPVPSVQPAPRINSLPQSASLKFTWPSGKAPDDDLSENAPGALQTGGKGAPALKFWRNATWNEEELGLAGAVSSRLARHLESLRRPRQKVWSKIGASYPEGSPSSAPAGSLEIDTPAGSARLRLEADLLPDEIMRARSIAAVILPRLEKHLEQLVAPSTPPAPRSPSGSRIKSFSWREGELRRQPAAEPREGVREGKVTLAVSNSAGQAPLETVARRLSAHLASLQGRPYSYLLHLECPRCGKRFDAHRLQTFCEPCRSPLLARYDLPALRAALSRDEVARRPGGMWRWHELLPARSASTVISLGEGDTPLLNLDRLANDFGLEHLRLKDEGANPTGSFKARGLATAVTRAYELGVTRIVIPTAGNAGGALAAYAARAGVSASIYMPVDTPESNRIESLITGAVVTPVQGLISDAAALAGEEARRTGAFDVSTFKEPYRVEGKKTMGYEIAQGYDWDLPDWILYPTGGGTGLVGIWKALAELAELGWLETDRRPRLVAVQAAGCAPVVRSFEEQLETCSFWENAHTAASGLRVPKPFADRLILSALRESNGLAVAVEEADIVRAQHSLAAREGLFVAPEGAATLAGLENLLARGMIQPGDRILLLNTGTGLKYLDQF